MRRASNPFHPKMKSSQIDDKKEIKSESPYSTIPAPRKKRATMFQIARLVYLLLVFVTGCTSIVSSQLIILLLFHNDIRRKNMLLRFTKQNFLVLLVYLTSKVSPTELILTFGDSPLLNNAVHTDPKTKRHTFNLDNHAIVIANHQIYSDWVFVWFIAYLNKCADQIFIVMKKSLEKLPVLGFGMRNYNFVFLSRNWARDRDYMVQSFRKVATVGQKCWLLIFPEGTNLSTTTYSKSSKYAEKVHMKPTENVLLPRARGLYLACKNLGSTTRTLYDLTIGYSGHSSEKMAQDVYTLSSTYLFGHGPKSISIHIDAIDIQHDIPEVDFSGISTNIGVNEEEEEIERFGNWLNNRWYKKDQLMKQYYETGKFENPRGKEYRMQLKLATSFELLNVYLIPLLAYVFGVIIYKMVHYLLH